MLGRIRAVIKATTLEVVSEPLFLLLTVSAVAVLTIASFLHIHQFGEPSGMPRDIGLSSVLVFGVLFAVFSSIRVFRREIESGTLQMALSHPISREAFFLSKVAGAFLACLAFFAIVFSSAVTTVVGAEVGKVHTAKMMETCGAHEEVLTETIWFVSLAVNVAVLTVPFLFGAILNRFLRFRFAATAFTFALFISVAGCCYNLFLAEAEFGDHIAGLVSHAVRLLPVGLLLLAPIAIFLSLGAALSVKFKDNAVASFAGCAFLLFLPALGNYYQTQAVSKGGELALSYVFWAFVSALPFIAAFLLLGMFLMRNKDVG
jgi:hypothetical protein